MEPELAGKGLPGEPFGLRLAGSEVSKAKSKRRSFSHARSCLGKGPEAGGSLEHPGTKGHQWLE